MTDGKRTGRHRKEAPRSGSGSQDRASAEALPHGSSNGQATASFTGGWEISGLPDELEEALARGWSIVPIRRDVLDEEGRKYPHVSWSPHQERPPDLTVVYKWWHRWPDALWAVITGPVSKLTVLDFDGPEGMETLGRLGLESHVQTPSGGAHVHVAVSWPTRTDSRVSDDFPGMDVRGGGGLALFYGERDMGSYVWDRNLSAYALDDLDMDLAALLEERRTDRRGESTLSERSGGSSLRGKPEHAHELIAMALGRISNDVGRNEAGHWLCQQLHDQGFPEDEVLRWMMKYREDVNDVRYLPGAVHEYTEAEVRATWKQVIARDRREPMLYEWSDLPDPFDPEVRKAVRQEHVRQYARDTVRQERAAAELRLPDAPLTLADDLAIEEPPLDWTVDSLHPDGGNTLIAAPAKAGKTTLMANLIRSLADAESFLGLYPVRELQGRVAVWNYEVSHRQLKGWLEEIGIQNPERAATWSLRGFRLPLIAPAAEDAAVEWLAEREVEVLIVDPLSRALIHSGLNENENADNLLFLDALDAIKERAGVHDLFVVDHFGHQHERARGGSVKLGWPDVLWNLTEDNGTRFLSAEGRDVQVPEMAMGFNPATRRLKVEGGSREDRRLQRGVKNAVRSVGMNEGLSKSELLDAMDGDTNKKPGYIEGGRAAGLDPSGPRTAGTAPAVFALPDRQGAEGGRGEGVAVTSVPVCLAVPGCAWSVPGETQV